mmetsp:Transcript_89580/g.149644  ORF Transcript_89580/g.149644 Transcript_89580/m.149644 type:complete len:321 (-) Transcript_89580:1864-2826(-)|eukprot:CAMPEP_0174351248 /NCGR_PEP_ID=MMETSP0811_2-20130205/8541_1 /TAXON_ID=73025 ORGANISM="Eutreptiella gymnastica-like, Strain CCMP1594" /NCGR_SAMPLE_ID=MMETSP0811_2 /ASSEMBLY_ACC=CAM_ASM_000667 /LENGTH=320 /DNA_ID=CAMNT_0015480285 /DNA_START=149 /DNA_END=1111 /DNA_ORIENTATION=-
MWPRAFLLLLLLTILVWSSQAQSEDDEEVPPIVAPVEEEEDSEEPEEYVATCNEEKELNELSVVLWTADEERGPDQYNCNTTTVAPVTWWRSVKFLEGELNDDNQAVGVGCTFTIQYQDSGEAISKWTADNITAFTLAVSGDRTLEFILVDSGEYGNCSVIVDLKFEQFPSWPAQIIYCVIGFFVILPVALFLAWRSTKLSNSALSVEDLIWRIKYRVHDNPRTKNKSLYITVMLFATIISFSLGLWFLCIGYSEWANKTTCFLCNAPLVCYLGMTFAAIFALCMIVEVIYGLLIMFGCWLPKYALSLRDTGFAAQVAQP